MPPESAINSRNELPWDEIGGGYCGEQLAKGEQSEYQHGDPQGQV
jgi:hypothetical protein